MLITEDLVFIHIPKAAGTSVTQGIADATGVAKYRGHPLVMNALTFQPHVPASVMSGIIARGEWARRWKLSVVRNPWDRMVSIYHYVMRPFKVEKWFGEEAPAIMGRIQTFGDFLQHYDMTELDVWWFDYRVPQIRWAEGVDDIFKIEETDTLETALRDHGYDVTIPKLNVSAGRRPGHYRDQYEPWSRDLVAEWFAEDIERFGYSF